MALRWRRVNLDTGIALMIQTVEETNAGTWRAKFAGTKFTPHLGRHGHVNRLLSSGFQSQAAERMENAFGALTKV